MLDEDFGLEVQAGAEAEGFVRGAGLAVDATVLATAVGIDTIAEADVGAVVFGEDRLGPVGDELRLEGGLAGAERGVGVKLLRVVFPGERPATGGGGGR